MKNDIQAFGYSEMYEWQEVPQGVSRFGKFVQFDKNYPNKIKLYSDTKYLLGITTTNSLSDSDNPEEWHGKFIANEYGDLYLRKERLAVGQKTYDQVKEISYIQTRPWEHHVPIENPNFNKNVKYIPRTSRQEWVRVNLIGKVIVEDNGKCVAGGWCKPNISKIIAQQGIAVPSTNNTDKHRFYVLERISDKTILILNK